MNKKCILFLLAVFCTCINVQAQNVDSSNFTDDYVKFTNDQKQFNDWSVSIYGGVPWLITSDFTSIDNGASSKWRVGYDFQASINKQISHVLGLSLLGQFGESKQGYGSNKVDAKTNYFALSILGDLNVSSLFRRIDNRSPYRWALHTYAGVGTIQYKAKTKFLEKGSTVYETMADQDMGLKSLFAQLGTGLTYKINKRWDASLRAMYVITGDELFDGSGNNGHYADLHKGSKSDNFLTTSLGVTYKIGKHNEFLGWVDPLREMFTKINDVASQQQLEVCVFGDKDDDGVCDDWDRELDTPKGARVDGSGRALDVDMDGIIDLYDKCPTFPGPASNDGCPEPQKLAEDAINPLIATMGGIQFNLDSDKILLESQPILDQVADIIIKYGQGTRFLVEGHTDARGTDAYNLNLSKRRVTSVIKYLVSKGVPPYQLTGKGMGFTNPKYPECKPASKCPEWKNKENRRVVFKLLDSAE
ncbi:OmpA family protein [Apibacter sp. B3889]|uniref:OmpA family protein n=1 Tax=unclassified Apibacter TaxID=2630820 RepID=UPI001326F2E7|nr:MULTISPECIES: OmpA family protein [unclassified Apibacter]MXO31729.1 OmpA family protein [Apibacter sp. B2912]MXO34230.1 OmpA family protein [Apibacter sp. B3883]MXO41639.1 OmpA family protein [Apibacter sp. B3889]MXP03209.1 OmpA family protein [Apibacter sp. B3887]MXP07528.1 OmpA family protein [Apibacter sp. B3935]